MSTTEILPTQTRLQTDIDISPSSYSVSVSDSRALARLYCDHQGIATTPPSPATTTLEDGNHSPSVESDDALFPSLPPLLRGHPDVHLRNGILKAASAEEPDAERAFFVADLGVVFRQHQRWKKCLPDIQPFYGGCFFLGRFILRGVLNFLV
jgi:hypothetical protein